VSVCASYSSGAFSRGICRLAGLCFEPRRASACSLSPSRRGDDIQQGEQFRREGATRERKTCAAAGCGPAQGQAEAIGEQGIQGATDQGAASERVDPQRHRHPTSRVADAQDRSDRDPYTGRGATEIVGLSAAVDPHTAARFHSSAVRRSAAPAHRSAAERRRAERVRGSYSPRRRRQRDHAPHARRCCCAGAQLWSHQWDGDGSARGRARNHRRAGQESGRDQRHHHPSQALTHLRLIPERPIWIAAHS
jgi:hypothetical protein